MSIFPAVVPKKEEKRAEEAPPAGEGDAPSSSTFTCEDRGEKLIVEKLAENDKQMESSIKEGDRKKIGH